MRFSCQVNNATIPIPPGTSNSLRQSAPFQNSDMGAFKKLFATMERQIPEESRNLISAGTADGTGDSAIFIRSNYMSHRNEGKRKPHEVKQFLTNGALSPVQNNRKQSDTHGTKESENFHDFTGSAMSRISARLQKMKQQE